MSESSDAIIYPVGHHIAIRELFVKDEIRKNDIMFIYNDPDVIGITSMNLTRDHNLLLVCDKKESLSSISVYNVSKLNFSQINIFRPKRKIVSSIYNEFIYSCFSTDGNYIASLGKITGENSLGYLIQGVIWDVQMVYQPFKPDNYKPRCIFDLPQGATKITLENKIICTSGEGLLTFWQIYENTVKPFKEVVNLKPETKNFVDHDWIKGKKQIIVALTDSNDIFVLEGVSENKKRDEDESIIQITKFVIRQHIENCFNDFSITSCLIKGFEQGLVVGSNQGHVNFLERINLPDQIFKKVRYTSREKISKVVGLSFNSREDKLAIAFNSNEICTVSTHNIFENLYSDIFELRFDVVCDGFHQGPITSMDVALQRPIIVTSSQVDKTIRVWNYLTGHCEYCKIILTEKDNTEKEIDLLSVAIHPNGYYMAVSDKDMIRFFHLCYKELRYYNNDVTGNETSKANCHLLKFSHGGHLLAAVSNKTLYIIRAYTRDTLKEFKTSHSGTIKGIYFDHNDHHVYTVGTEGIITEFNLFSFRVEEITTRYVFTGGSFCLNGNIPSILACGLQSQQKSLVAEVQRGEDRDNSPPVITQFNRRMDSILQIISKKYDIPSIVIGSDDGVLTLAPYPLNNVIEFDHKKAHRSAIRHIAFSRDTNLIFTAGDDGNLFIYCLYELPDGELIAMDDNKTLNLNQLTTILDEGLGENVLFPLNQIAKYENKITVDLEEIINLKKQETKLVRDNEIKLRDRENELNRNKEKELKDMVDMIKEMKVEKEATIEFYEDKIKNLINENNRILIEKERVFNDRMDQNSNIIHDLNAKLHFQANDHELELKKKDEEYEKKFRVLESELRKKFDELKVNNIKLTDEISQRQKLEQMKFNHLDQEHEQEINFKQEKYEKEITKLKEEIARLQNDYKQKCEQLVAKEASLLERENEVKNLKEQKALLTNQNDKAKALILEKENEFNELKKKFTESEKSLQEEKKVAVFSSKLKNELYRRNTDIMGNYNKQQGDINEMKTNTKSLENELEESLKLLENYEKELKKNKILINELKKKCDDEHAYGKQKEADFDNLLQKIYNAFQTADKNKIISEIREIYVLYLTGDVQRKIDSSKLNINIKDELEKQIDFLQKSLINVTEIRGKKEIIQKSEINRRTSENSTLIAELNANKTKYTLLEKEWIHLKSENSALKKTIANYQRREKEKEKEVNKKPLHQLQSSSEGVINMIGMNNNYKDDELPLVFQNNDIFGSSNHRNKPLSGVPDKGLNKWKGKIYTGSNAARLKINEEQQKIGQILQIIEEKNELILKQKLEIQRLKGIVDEN